MSDDKFSKKVVFIKEKNATDKFIEAIPKEYDYCKKIIKKHFKKNLVMSEEDETNGNQKCRICNKLM